MKTHGKSSTYRAGCRCDECRLRHNDRMRAYFASKGGNPYRKQTMTEHACSDCGTVWQSTTSRKDVRCRDCALARRRKSRALVLAEPDPPTFCPLPDRHPAMRTYPKPRLWVSGPCAWCGETFTIRDQSTARFCSTSCSRKHDRAARGRFLIRRSDRLAIYERDEWTCQLCMEPVDPDLPTSDIWAATLDHIRCQAWGDKPDHSPENLRLAHRWCNSVRGDETYYTADMLVA